MEPIIKPSAAERRARRAGLVVERYCLFLQVRASAQQTALRSRDIGGVERAVFRMRVEDERGPVSPSKVTSAWASIGGRMV